MRCPRRCASSISTNVVSAAMLIDESGSITNAIERRGVPLISANPWFGRSVAHEELARLRWEGPRRAMASMSSRHLPWKRLLLVAAGLLTGFAAGGCAAFYWLFLRNLPDPHTIADYRPRLASTVVDRTGHPIGEFFEERRRIVSFDEVPEHVVAAFVSAEDSNFFEHEGI